LSGCQAFGNFSVGSINNNMPTLFTGDSTHSLSGLFDGSSYVLSPNSGTQFQIGGGNNFQDPFFTLVPSTGEIQLVPFLSGSPGGKVSTRGPNGTKASETFAGCETSAGITTLSTVSTTTTTGLSCLPANSIIDAVVYRISSTITTAATFQIGDATIAGRFSGALSGTPCGGGLTAASTGICFVQADQTGTSGPRQVSAAPIVITTNVNPGAGSIRLIVFYHTWTPPTT
jgi:hypothetical protein